MIDYINSLGNTSANASAELTSGYSVIVGSYKNTIEKDGILTRGNYNNSRALVSILDPSGNTTIINSGTGDTVTDASEILDVATNGDEIYVCGRFRGSLTWSTLTVTAGDLGLNLWNPFIAKIDLSGNCSWLVSLKVNGISDNHVNNLRANRIKYNSSTNKLYVAMYLGGGECTYGGGKGSYNDLLPLLYNEDRSLLLCLNPSTTVISSYCEFRSKNPFMFPSPNNEDGVNIDDINIYNGEVYICGTYYKTLTVAGVESLTNTTRGGFSTYMKSTISSGYNSIKDYGTRVNSILVKDGYLYSVGNNFYNKIDSSGNVLNELTFKSYTNCNVKKIVDGGDRLYMCGNFSDRLIFNSKNQITSVSDNDMFVAEIKDEQFVNVFKGGGNELTRVNDIRYDSTNNKLFILGEYVGRSIFKSAGTDNKYNDMFIWYGNKNSLNNILCIEKANVDYSYNWTWYDNFMFKMSFNNILNAPTSGLTGWNTFFETNTYADKDFLHVVMNGNDISVSGPSALTIKDNLFLNNSAITSIDDANIVTSVGNSSFRGCNNLHNISLMNISSIDINGFYDCVSLNYINLPNVSSVGKSSFYMSTTASALTYLNLSSCTTIGSTAFRYISGCTMDLYVPLSITGDTNIAYLLANNNVTMHTT